MADVQAAVEALSVALDVLVSADPTSLGDGEAVVFLHRQLARLEAATTRATAAFDASRGWESDGARSAAAWVATRCHPPKTAAHRRVRLGRELRTMPVVEEAWADGDIGEAQVGKLARARGGRRAEVFAEHEEMLVGHARSLSFGHFCRALAYWCYRADPDGCE